MDFVVIPATAEEGVVEPSVLGRHVLVEAEVTKQHIEEGRAVHTELQIHSVALPEHRKAVTDSNVNRALSGEAVQAVLPGMARPVRNPANGHSYVLVDERLPWEQARARAESIVWKGMRGHLATLTSAEETDWIQENVPFGDGVTDFWIGGSQSGGSEPGEGWQWITGELWEWTNWFKGEPNDQGKHQDHLRAYRQESCCWDDCHGWWATVYLVEFEGKALAEKESEIGTAKVDQVVYFDDFEGDIGPEWSSRKIDVTPKGKRRYLGQFANETVTLHLEDLLPHNELTISFDLFVIRSWDGNHPVHGRDVWNLTARGVGTLLHTTFSNWSKAGQSYPKAYGQGDFPMKTGAAEKGTLGYAFRTLTDSVYHLSLTFPHAGHELTLHFSAMGLEGPVDLESWGLDNVGVTLLKKHGAEE